MRHGYYSNIYCPANETELLVDSRSQMRIKINCFVHTLSNFVHEELYHTKLIMVRSGREYLYTSRDKSSFPHSHSVTTVTDLMITTFSINAAESNSLNTTPLVPLDPTQ